MLLVNVHGFCKKRNGFSIYSAKSRHSVAVLPFIAHFVTLNVAELPQ